MDTKWRTSIKPAYKRRCVIRATLLSGAGAFGLAAAGIYIPQSTLAYWGLPLFAVALALITWGMLPYRRITQLENYPDELWINSKGDVVYGKQNFPVLTIPHSIIDTVFYIDKPGEYGICIALMPYPLEKVRIHAISFDYKGFQSYSIRRAGCDLFFPFFSERSFQGLQTCLEDVHKL